MAADKRTVGSKPIEAVTVLIMSGKEVKSSTPAFIMLWIKSKSVLKISIIAVKPFLIVSSIISPPRTKYKPTDNGNG